MAILSVAALVAGLFGSQLGHRHEDLAAKLAVGVAVVLFAGTVCLTLYVLWPRRWNFDHSLVDILDLIANQELVDAPSLAYTWAKGFEQTRDADQVRLDGLMTKFAVACLLTGLQVAAWGAALLV